MTDPASPPLPTTPAASAPGVSVAGLRLLTTDDDLACLDDRCLPLGPRDRLDTPEDPTRIDVPETAP